MQAAEQVSKDQPRATFRGITFKRPVGSLTLESGNLADSQSGSLLVLNKTEAKLPQSGKLLRRFKLRNLGSNEIFEVALDETGKEVDAERLLQHEFAAIGQQRGKLSEDLIHRMNSNLGKGGIPVALRLRGDDVVSTRQPVSAESAKRISKDERRRLANEAQLRNHAAQRARYVRSQEAVLSMARVRDPWAHGTPEMGTVYANLIESEIRELAAMPEVEEIGVVVQGEDLMGNALDTTDVNPEVHVTREFRGDEVRVGIVDSSGRVRSTNPPFSGASITQGNTAACYGSQEHSTPVAGVIVGQDADNPGIAPAALLYAAGKCDGSSSAVESETTNAINWGVSIMNVSWGGEPAGETNRPNDTDKWFDRQVIDGWKFLTVAAGNRGAADCVQGSDGRLLRPALGYNVLTVGNFNDRNSAEWGGDTPDIMAPCSSWVNPDSTRGDRAKPEVAAPGTNLWTARGTDAAPWMGNSSGTSVAAPFVAGLSALMIQADPVLDGWPEVVKAIIIATARHNIEGSSVFSEFDGAGGVYGLDAVRLAASEFGDWHGTSIDCSSAFPVLRSLPLVAGRQTRVAIAWDQNPDYANYEFRPSADHDLVIVNDDQDPIAWSTSFDNTYEVVDFTPSVTATYTARISQFRCDLTPKYMGFAYYQVP